MVPKYTSAERLLKKKLKWLVYDKSTLDGGDKLFIFIFPSFYLISFLLLKICTQIAQKKNNRKFDLIKNDWDF